MRSDRSHIESLRLAIDCLPVHTREAMLEGVRSNPIIAGAYVGDDGGICPMLAAHRNGGRTNFISFARAWDAFTGVKRRSRRATRRELAILTSHLEQSLLTEEQVDLGVAVREHEQLMARRAAAPKPARHERSTARTRRTRPGDPDRSRELSGRHGWSWLRPVRNLEDYERALRRVEREAPTGVPLPAKPDIKSSAVAEGPQRSELAVPF